MLDQVIWNFPSSVLAPCCTNYCCPSLVVEPHEGISGLQLLSIMFILKAQLITESIQPLITLFYCCQSILSLTFCNYPKWSPWVCKSQTQKACGILTLRTWQLLIKLFCGLISLYGFPWVVSPLFSVPNNQKVLSSHGWWQVSLCMLCEHQWDWSCSVSPPPPEPQSSWSFFIAKFTLGGCRCQCQPSW